MVPVNKDPTSAQKPKFDAANPTPLGYFAFGYAIFILCAAFVGVINGGLGIFVGPGYFCGGLVQILAGLWAIKRNDDLRAITFCSFGTFFVSIAVMTQLRISLVGNGLAFFLLGWAVFTFLLLCSTYRTNFVTIAFYLLLFVAFASMSISSFLADGLTGIIGISCGFATVLLSWYIGLSELLSDTGSSIRLPLFPTYQSELFRFFARGLIKGKEWER